MERKPLQLTFDSQSLLHGMIRRGEVQAANVIRHASAGSVVTSPALPHGRASDRSEFTNPNPKSCLMIWSWPRDCWYSLPRRVT